jgi:hypothetical protein
MSTARPPSSPWRRILRSVALRPAHVMALVFAGMMCSPVCPLPPSHEDGAEPTPSAPLASVRREDA